MRGATTAATTRNHYLSPFFFGLRFVRNSFSGLAAFLNTLNTSPRFEMVFHSVLWVFFAYPFLFVYFVMNHPLDGIRQKIIRANEHLTYIRNEVQR